MAKPDSSKIPRQKNFPTLLVPWGAKHKTGGRPKGSINKTTRILKEALLLAAEMSGFPDQELGKVFIDFKKDAEGNYTTEKMYTYELVDKFKGRDGLLGYLKYLAQKHPAVFANMLIKVLPIQIQQHEDQPAITYRTAEEISEALTSKGLPVKVIDAIADRVFSSPARLRVVDKPEPPKPEPAPE